MATASQKIRVWRVGANASAGIQVNEDSVEITANPKNTIIVADTGVGVVGKSFTLGMGSENIRHAGLFVETGDFAAMIPSTIVTPLPKRIPFPPLGFVTSMLKTLPVFIAAMQSISKDEV